MDSNKKWSSPAECFLHLFVGCFFFLNPEQTVHRSDVAEKKGYKLPFSGLE